jgi:replicative DNA helicase
MTDTGHEGAPQPPHDLDAERVTLGAMMLKPVVLDEIATFLKPGDHYRGAHQVIHEAVIRLREAGLPTDPVAVGAELRRAGHLRGSLDGNYLHDLITLVPTAANGPHFARIVLGHAQTREIQAALERALAITRNPGFRPSEDMDRIRQAVDNAMGDAAPAETAEWLSTAAWDFLARLEKPLPPDEITVPYADLREIVPALRPGQLITVAARPSIGKTVVVGDFARHVALNLGLPVAWFTLEMTRDEIITRTFAAEAVVDQEHIQGHNLDDAEWARLAAVTESFNGSRVLIDEKSAATLAHIRAGLRRISRTVAPRMMVIDYVQLAESPGASSRQEEVSRLARGLKEIAKDHGIPVIMAAQLNRNPEMRHDKRPIQADLRESGEIENSSDIIILLHREDYYERESPRAGEMDLIITKNRNGRTNLTVTVSFQGRFCRCVDRSTQEPPARAWSPHDVIGDAA